MAALIVKWKQMEAKTLIDIKGYEGLYAVTGDGRVYAWPRIWLSGHSTTRKHSGRWISSHMDKDGYPVIALTKDGATKTVKVHRLVAGAFISNPHGKPEVNHLDGVKANALSSNLEWVTTSENQRHAFAIGLSTPLRGEHGPAAKLTGADVSKIRELALSGRSHTYIATIYPVTRQTISKICSGQSWVLVR